MNKTKYWIGIILFVVAYVINVMLTRGRVFADHEMIDYMISVIIDSVNL